MTLQGFAPLFVPGGFGGMEIAIIFLIAVLLFGANKIPKLARSTGQAMGEFQRGRTEIEQELEEMTEPPTAEGETVESSVEDEVEPAVDSEAEPDDTDETK